MYEAENLKLSYGRIFEISFYILVEKNQDYKVFVKRLETSNMSELTTDDGRVVSSKPHIWRRLL